MRRRLTLKSFEANKDNPPNRKKLAAISKNCLCLKVYLQYQPTMASPLKRKDGLASVIFFSQRIIP
jgi:hypothetical protein